MGSEDPICQIGSWTAFVSLYESIKVWKFFFFFLHLLIHRMTVKYIE